MITMSISGVVDNDFFATQSNWKIINDIYFKSIFLATNTKSFNDVSRLTGVKVILKCIVVICMDAIFVGPYCDRIQYNRTWCRWDEILVLARLRRHSHRPVV